MKKSIKILTLVLSLALICGALVVAAFAEGETTITGIRLDVSADMSDPTVETIPTVPSGNVETKFEQDNGAAAALAFKHQVGGVPQFVKNPVDQNTYLTVDWGTETSKDGHFLHAYVKNGWGIYNSTNSGVEFIDDFQYFVADFDISFFDPANFSGGTFIPYVTRAKAAVDKDGNPTVSRNDIGSNFQVSFAKANDLVYTHFSSNGDQKAVIGDGSSWHHITYILGAQTFDDNGDENIKANMYLAVDGKIIATKTWTNDLSDANSYQNDRTQIGIMGVRLDAFGKSGSSGNVDNVVYRTLTKDYNGNLASVLAGGIGANLTAWESNIYDADNMPYGIHAAMLGETPYETLQAAVDAANAGDTITLCANVPVKVTINKPLTINCGEYTLATPNVEGAYAGVADDTAKTYEVKPATVMYVQGGVTKYTLSFKDAIANVSDGQTVTLLADVNVDSNKKITISKNVTIDLNGHLLDAFHPYNSTAYYTNSTKITTFGMSDGKTVVFKGDKEGSAIISTSATSEKSFVGTFINPSKNSTIRFEGEHLRVSVPQLAATWGVTGWTITFDGGYYGKGNSSDGAGYIYANAASTGVTVNIKNAVVNASGAVAGGVGADGASAKLVCNVENSVFVNALYTNGQPDVSFNISGSYLSGITTTVKNKDGTTSIVEPTAVVIGANCYFTDASWINCSTATYAEGVSKFDVSIPVNHTIYSHTFKVMTENEKIVADPSSREFTATNKATTYAYASATGESAFDVKYIKGGNTYYTSGPDALKTAISNADADTDVTDDVATIVLLNDISINLTGDLSISKNITINLGGKTLYLDQSAQAGFAPTTGISFKLMNGTVCVAAENSYANNKTDMQTHAIVTNIGSNAKVYYKDVNTYGYAITYSWGNAYSVFVDGGEHHMYTNFDNLTYPGWICGNNNITAEVKNASIYLEYKAAYLVGFQNYKAAAGTTPKSTAYFYNCTIVDTDETAGIIAGLNKYSTVNFEKCDIFGNIAPGKTDLDITKNNSSFGATDNVPVNGSITIGAGCRFTDATKGNAVVKVADGVKLYDNDVTVTLNVNKASGLWNTDEFAITSTTQEVTFNLVDATAVSGVDFVFEYVKGGITYLTPETGTDTIVDILNVATVGSTIKLLKDYTWKGTKVKYVQRDYTLDLGGFTLTHQQSLNSAKNYTTSYLELQNGTFTIKNGTIRAMLLDAEGNDTGKNYPFIRMTHASAVYKSITLNVENVNTYVGPFIYNMTAPGVTVNVTGGEHHLTNSSQNVSGSFIESRANTNATVTGAKFYVSNSTNGLVISMSYNQTTGDKASSFVFDGCEIVCNSSNKNIVPNSNEFTTIAFNNCKIVGSINPAKHSFDSTLNGPKTGSIVLDNNTTIDADLVLADVVSMSDATMQQFSFKYIAAGVTYYTSCDLATAISRAGEDTDVTDDVATLVLLDDIEVHLTANLSISKNITIDLNGHTLFIEQDGTKDAKGNFNGSYSLVTSKSLKFMNGTVMLAASEQYGFGKATAIVQPNSGAKIYFKDTNTYGYALAYSYDKAYSIFVDGGEHHVNATPGNLTYPGWICGNHNITAEVKNASIYLEYKAAYLVGFQNYKAVEAGITPKSTASFYNCTIVDTDETAGIIAGLNKYSTVNFEKCDIFGKIAPGATSNDAAADKNPVAGSIVIGVGCRFTNDTIGNSAVKVDTGVRITAKEFTETLTFKAANSLWNVEGFKLEDSTKTVTYTVCDAALAGDQGDVVNNFTVIVNGEAIGSYADLASAIEAAPAGATVKLLSDVTIDAYGLIATIDKALTIDLNGKHLQIIQYVVGGQIYINTTAPVTITNGRISCAADATYRKTLTTTTSAYDVGEPIFVATSVAVDFTLNGISTYSAGLFYNTVSGSKFTVIGGYHKQNSITYPNQTYLDRALVVSKANITVLFQNASIDMDWCGGLLISTAQNESSYDNARSTFTYENCQVYYTGNDNQIIRVANDKTFVYFKGSDVYGAFVRPTKKDGSIFTSANLHFDANTTWYNVNPSGKTLVTPTLPEGYVFVSAAGSAAKISFTKYDITGQIHAGTLIFPATSTTGSFTVGSVVVKEGDLAYKITAGDKVNYYSKDIALADIVTAAMSYDGAVVTFLTDITFQPTGYMNITKNVTFDLDGHVLTLIHDGQDKTFNLNAAVTAKFEDGTIITTPGASYAKNNSTFCFVYVSVNNANLVFDGVDGRVTTLVYAWGASYTITVNDGTFVLDTTAAGMNTSGFISGQANITATVNNTTLFVENGYILGASSYRQFHNQNNKETTIEDVKKGIKSTFTFNNCNIIGNNVNKNLISNANEFTTVTFNGGTIYGNISPIKNASDGTLKYIQIGNKFYVNPTACTCTTFIDTNGDGKCDNVVGESACGKFDPASIKSFTFADSTAANFIIGKGTYFSASTNIKVKTTLADKLIAQNIAKNITIGGINYSFDYVTDYVYVIWHDANGNELNKVPVDGNFTGIVAPEYTVPTTGANNGWYQIGGFVQGGWTTTFGGTTAVDFSTITEFTANLNFYPQASGGITAYLSAAMYNLSIVGQIRNNFYIPVDMPENVKILGVYIVDENGNKIKDVSGTEILFKDHRNEPVYYTMYIINYVDAIALTESTRVWVDYTVNDITLTQKYTISPEKYVNTVYADYVNETEQYNDAAYNVVADLVRYSYFISVYANAESTALTDLYSKMMALCSELPTEMTPDASVDTSNLAGLGTIAFEASQFNPRWKFTLNESAQIVDIKITLQGYNAGFLNDRTNFGTQTYGITNVTKANGYITSAYTVNIPVYNLIQPFTITMTKADGTEISAIFDLNSYYQSVKGTAAAADFLESVVALANSTIAYKFPDGKVTVNDIADFWECDHPADMVNKLDEVVAYTNVFKPHYCQKCDSYLFYYEDYGAVADGVTAHKRATHISGTNNYEAIYWTHANANEWKARTDLSGGKHVAVIGNSDPTVAKNYYISLPEGIGLYKIDTNRDGVVDTVYKNGQNLGSIIVATDTSWNGVNLLIDDDSICNNYASNYDSKDTNKPTEPCDCGRKHAYVDQPIFTLDEYGSEKVEQNWKGKLTSLSAGATNIGFAPGRDMLVHLVDADKKIYLRYGANASNGNAISEVILVHADGSIDPSTPVQWDYTNLNNQDSDKVIAYAVDAEEIKISGLDANGQINAIFETYVNNDVKQYLYHYEQTARNITIRRSNATVEGLDRIFLEEAADNANNTNDRMAYTFIKVEYCSDVTVKDMLVMNHNSHSGDTGTSQGSYEFSAGYANDVKWINCDTKNMFSAGKDGSLLAYPVYRGLFGTNHMRNMYLADCFLNSFDSHTGAYNVTIERSTFDHMNFIGGGLIKLTDVTIYTASNYGSAINLRTDYGSTWNGDLEIDGLTVKYGIGSKPERITLIYGSYTNQYWGFDTYMPQNVTINNFHVESYKAEIVNGERVETFVEQDGNITVYYYYATNSLKKSNVPDTSAEGKYSPEGDLINENATSNYGTNHLECTKNLTITNSVTLTLPTGDFWADMKVTIDECEYVFERDTDRYGRELTTGKFKEKK